MLSYIHIPFCESKCKYCRFASIGNINQILVNKYLAHLENDIKIFKRPEGNTSGLLDSVYFGGGTPSVLNQSQLQNILQNLKIKFGFNENIEITLETTPKNVTKENLISWYNIGITRISIGIQSLNNKTLNTINRDNYETIINTLNNLKNSKIKNISLDFIVGLPYVKKGELLNDIKYILNNYDYIKHISVYMLEDYYETSASIFDDNSKFELINYPNDWKNLGINEDEFLDEYLEIKSFLEKKLFSRYEISNFSKPGYECKHNKGYWDHKEYVGFGLGAHSFLNNTRYAYKDDFLGYYSKKYEYLENLSENDLFLEKILFQSRTTGIKKEVYEKLSNEKIKNHLQNGYMYFENDLLKINDKYIALLDKIILELI